MDKKSNDQDRSKLIMSFLLGASLASSVCALMYIRQKDTKSHQTTPLLSSTLPKAIKPKLVTNDTNTEMKYVFSDSGYCKAQNKACATNRFHNKTIVITGGMGGFGYVCASRFASEGANVALWDIRDPTSVAEELQNKYPSVRIEPYTVNVTDEETVAKATLSVINDFGRIDYLFNNAGLQGEFAPIHTYSTSDFRKIFDINVTGIFIVAKSVSQAMMKQRPQGGVIVNTASMAGVGVPPNMIAYGSSKAAIIQFSRLAAKDLAPYNIRVNSVSPGLIGPGFMWARQIDLQSAAETIYFDQDPKKSALQFINSTQMKRYGSVEEVIGPVSFLFSDDASYLTGIDLRINGGMI